MKKIIFLLILSSFSAFSQTSKFQFEGRMTPSVSKGNLNYAKTITELMPQFWDKLGVPYFDRVLLDEMLNYRKFFDSEHQKYFYLQDSYDKIVECVLVEIGATCNGKALVAQSKNNQLTAEQKNILNAADLGSDIQLSVRFKLKNTPKPNNLYLGKLVEGRAYITVVPETEAEYRGGNKQLSEYLKANFINKIYDEKTVENLRRMDVKFTVNEEGQVEDAKLLSSSGVEKIDKLLLDAIRKMPKWKPAKNQMGKNVKQEFRIPFGGC